MDDNERNIFNESNENNESIEKSESIKNTENIGNTDYNYSGYNSSGSNGINFVIPSVEEPKKKKNKSKKKTFFGYVAVALVAALIGGLSGGYLVTSRINISGNESSSALTAQNVNINLTDDVYFAVAVAEKSQKTVVGITADVVQQYNTIFGPQTQKGQSMGSGFIIDPNGYILTNAHVVGDGKYDKISVSLIDGSNEEGQVLWYDTTLDLAVVKINKTGLPAVELGDSDELKVGEPAVAIGNPMTLDLERTVTQGIISGLDRSVTFENGTVIKPLIQTDASINSGNSGGPLLNAKGQVIGINTAKMSTAEGLGFAIPINTAKPIVEQIMKTGTFSTVYLGIKGVDVDTYKSALGVDVSAQYGVVVVETTNNSPAAEAGLMTGDVITAIDGKKVESMSDLKKNLYGYKENDNAEVTILRNGAEQKVTMTLKTKPADYQ